MIINSKADLAALRGTDAYAEALRRILGATTMWVNGASAGQAPVWHLEPVNHALAQFDLTVEGLLAECAAVGVVPPTPAAPISAALLTTPGPVSAPQIDSWGLARFTVSSGVLTPTGDAKNIAGVLRLGTGKYRILFDMPPPETLMAFPVALDPSNDRRAFPATRAAGRFDIRVVNSAGVLSDAAEVCVELKRISQ